MHILGAGGHAKVVTDILEASMITIAGIWDQNSEVKSFLNYPIVGDFEAFKQLSTGQYIIAIGNNVVRKNLSAQFCASTALAVHPKSYIAASAVIGFGTVIMANATINPYVEIGEHVIINTGASIDHDCKIASFVHISPQAALTGKVEVGEGTHIGVGASIIPGIKIGKWATIGAGAVIIKDVPDYAVVVGNPGKVIKYNRIED